MKYLAHMYGSEVALIIISSVEEKSLLEACANSVHADPPGKYIHGDQGLVGYEITVSDFNEKKT